MGTIAEWLTLRAMKKTAIINVPVTFFFSKPF
jgi:hypothetical protein